MESRKAFYDWLANEIAIEGIVDVDRDTNFDDETYYRSGGIRLRYENHAGSIAGLKEGILLEVGFDDITPNAPCAISSWAYDHARDSGVDVIDNRAIGVACYHPGFTLVEKLQTISTKFRRQQETGEFPANFMRHYYDVYCLLNNPLVLAFIGSDDYAQHKKKRFRSSDNPLLSENEAFLLRDERILELYQQAFQSTRSLYYKGQPSFEEIMKTIVDATVMDGI